MNMDVGVIGTGIMGRNHARVYSELKSVGSVFVYDVNARAAEEVGRSLGVSVSPSLEDLLGHVDAVSIAVPTPFHHDIARKCIERRVHMLIEKPMCGTAEEAETLVRSIPDDLIVGVGHLERFNPIVKEIRRIVKRPLYVEAKRHNPASARIQGTSVVEDLMIHDIDIIFSLFANGRFVVHSQGNDDIRSALFSMSGIPIYLSASRKASKKIRSIYIEEEESTIEGDFMSQEIFVYWKPDRYRLESARYLQENIIEKLQVNKVEPLRIELETFLQCVKHGTSFPISPEDGLQNLRVCELVKSSNGRVEVGIPSPGQIEIMGRPLSNAPPGQATASSHH